MRPQSAGPVRLFSTLSVAAAASAYASGSATATATAVAKAPREKNEMMAENFMIEAELISKSIIEFARLKIERDRVLKYF